MVNRTGRLLFCLYTASLKTEKKQEGLVESGVCFTPWLKHFDLFASLLREIYSVLQRALEGSA